jgi:hypothetical protein
LSSRASLPDRTGCAARQHRQEVFAVRWVFVFLPQKLAVSKGVQIGRRRAGSVLTLIQMKGPAILREPKQEFFLLLTGRLLLPGRERDGHPNGANSHDHNQHGHHEPGCVRLL